jgi:hypothetical protein
MQSPAVQARLAPVLEAGEAATCAIIDLEVLYSTRNAEDHAQVRARRALAYERIALDEAIFERAIAVQGQLARTGRHRIPIPDLVIAAAAESAQLVVLHYDRDFDVIAEVTGQPTEWVVAPGAV